MFRLKNIATLVFFLSLILFGAYIGSQYFLSTTKSLKTDAQEPNRPTTNSTQKLEEGSTNTHLTNLLTNNQEADKNSLKIPHITQISPDGILTLIIEQTVLDQNQIQYKILSQINQENIHTTQAQETGQPKLLYTLNLPSGTSVEIPFNTWSPQNEYFFIKTTNATAQYQVYKADGTPFNTNQFIVVNSYFDQKETLYQLEDITGWAARSLLLIITRKEDGTTGPSYWFDVNNLTFTQLSTQF